MVADDRRFGRRLVLRHHAGGILIAVGAALGFLVGELQVFAVLHH